MAYSVEFYLQRYKERVQGICEYEAQRRGFDTQVIHKEATQQAIDTSIDYHDGHGTNGFVRWFTKLTSELCDHFKNNRDEYAAAKNSGYKHTKEPVPSLTSEMKEIVMGEYVKVENNSPTKHCDKCDTDKVLDDFHNNASKPDGKADYCKSCVKIYWNKSKEQPKLDKKTTPPPPDGPTEPEIKIQLVLSNEDIEAMIQIYAEKLANHLKNSGVETDRLTAQVTKWTNILNKRKAK